MGGRRRWWALVGLVAVLALVALAVVVASSDDDDDPTTTTTTTTSSTTTSSTTTTTTTVPGRLGDAEADTVVWPGVDGAVRYGSPEAAARGFATELAGFDRPRVGTYRAGDARSGEVPVLPAGAGPETTVLVRRLGDGNWWVVGAQTEEIQLEEPVAGATVPTPLPLRGRARAFEGNVQVSVLALGGTEPIGEGFVTGSGGPDLGPFAGEVAWRGAAGRGVLLLYTSSADDGSVRQAAAVPVRLGP